MAAGDTLGDQDAANDIVLNLSGGLLGHLRLIDDAEMALLVGTGTIAGDPVAVLVPCIDFSFDSMGFTDDEEEVEHVANTIPFENAALILGELAADLSAASGQLRQMSRPGLAPEPSRLREALAALRAAQTALGAASDDIEAILRATAITPKSA